MKKILLAIVFIYSTIISSGQITLEKSGYHSTLRFVHLERAGFKYVYHDPIVNEIRLYNLNHSLYKIINIPPQNAYQNNYYVQYLTETLWDTDSTDLDYACTGLLPPVPPGHTFTRIYH